MPDRPLVSVLVPAYQSEHLLVDAVESALVQTYADVEVVIVDDGSADGTFDVARRFEASYPDRIRAFRQENAGACAARNRAFAESRGAYVKFLDADDALAPDAVATQVSALAGEPDTVIAYGDLVSCDADLVPKPGPVRPQDDASGVFSDDVAERVAWLLGHNIQTARPLHPRKLVALVGGFDETLGRAQEYDFHLRLALAGGRFKRVPGAAVLLRHHSSPTRITNTGGASRFRKHAPARERIREAFGDDLPRPIRRALAQIDWRAVRTHVQAGRLEAANSKADDARRLDPGIEFAGPIRVLYRSLGPVRTELAYMKAKLLWQRASRAS